MGYFSRLSPSSDEIHDAPSTQHRDRHEAAGDCESTQSTGRQSLSHPGLTCRHARESQEGQNTAVTESHGPLAGQHVLRGSKYEQK